MRRLLLFPLMLAVVLASGCMKMHMDTEIEKDGSGTCTVTYRISRPVADAFEKMSAGGGGAMGLDAGPPQLKELTRAHMEEIGRKAGVKVLEHRFEDGADGVGLTMKLGFPDVGALSQVLNELNGGGGEQPEILGIFRTDDGDYVLKSTPAPAAASAPEEAEDEDVEDAFAGADDPAAMAEAMQQMSVLMSHLGELDMRLTFTVPGDVIHSNAMEVEGRTSIWTVNAANMMQAGESEMKPEIRFSGKGLNLKAAKP